MASTREYVAFPPFEKGGQGGFALRHSQKQIPLCPPFSKGEKAKAEKAAAEKAAGEKAAGEKAAGEKAAAEKAAAETAEGGEA
jgi:hypothetical protein